MQISFVLFCSVDLDVKPCQNLTQDPEAKKIEYKVWTLYALDALLPFSILCLNFPRYILLTNSFEGPGLGAVVLLAVVPLLEVVVEVVVLPIPGIGDGGAGG